MRVTSLESLTEIVELADQLRAGRDTMFEPRDLPGRFGRVAGELDRLLQAMNCPAVVGGGWAVWHHGYTARVTEDIDIVLPADRIDEFLRVAAASGFDVLPLKPGRWPKLLHKQTGVKVDILPEGARPGSDSKPAPTTIRHPARMGAESTLQYVNFLALMELKIAAGRSKDDTDVIEVIRANFGMADLVRRHLANIHPDYAAAFDRLVERAREQRDE